jgi:hypothetical protein
MTKRELQEKWIIEQVKATQVLGCTQPEIDLRYALVQEFHIKPEWAYQLIKELCEKNPQLHREKVTVGYYGDAKGKEFEITWRE